MNKWIVEDWSFYVEVIHRLLLSKILYHQVL